MRASAGAVSVPDPREYRDHGGRKIRKSEMQIPFFLFLPAPRAPLPVPRQRAPVTRVTVTVFIAGRTRRKREREREGEREIRARRGVVKEKRNLRQINLNIDAH